MQARVRVARFRVGQDQFVVVSEPIVGAADFPALSEAEREVARLVADGHSLYSSPAHTRRHGGGDGGRGHDG
jgi:hypothetical protein